MNAKNHTEYQQCIMHVDVKKKIGAQCSFQEKFFKITVNEGECVWLKGPSGVGKTQTALYIMGLQEHAGLGTIPTIYWNNSIPIDQRVGMLFQNGVLIDSLTVRENLLLALSTAGLTSSENEVKKYLEMVGLKYGTDASKMPGILRYTHKYNAITIYS